MLHNYLLNLSIKDTNMKMVLLASLLILLASPITDAKEKHTLNNKSYQVGQVWAYKTRKAESNSRLYIVKVDSDAKLKTIYHIYIDKVAIKNPYIRDGGIQNVLPHAPVSKATLDASVTQLISVKASPLPDITEGYKAWKDEYSKGEAGVFTISVSDILKYIEKAVSAKS